MHTTLFLALILRGLSSLSQPARCAKLHGSLWVGISWRHMRRKRTGAMRRGLVAVMAALGAGGVTVAHAARPSPHMPPSSTDWDYELFVQAWSPEQCASSDVRTTLVHPVRSHPVFSLPPAARGSSGYAVSLCTDASAHKLTARARSGAMYR